MKGKGTPTFLLLQGQGPASYQPRVTGTGAHSITLPLHANDRLHRVGRMSRNNPRLHEPCRNLSPRRILELTVLTGVWVAVLAIGPDWRSRASEPNPAAPSGSVTAAGSNFVQLLAQGSFSQGFGRFDAAMKNALPEPKLKEVWDGLEKQVGRFQRQLRSRTFRQAGYDIVLVTCQFERAVLDTKVVFNSQRMVSGLFFVPAPTEPETSQIPAYADTNRFQELELNVGSGGTALEGTLSLPKPPTNPLRAVVLVHGSGPQDRNETVGSIQPFRDLAWGLASRGIAVLRYEKRTKAHPEQLSVARITLKEETIDDAVSAVELLRQRPGIDRKNVYVLGHSLGGMAAPRIAQADTNIAGLIILAGSTRPLEDLVVEQTRYLLSLKGVPTADETRKADEIEAEMAKVKRLTTNSPAGTMILGAPAGYWLDLRHYDAVATAKGLALPMMICQGGRDYQVTTADLDGWKKGLGQSSSVTFKEYPTLNHLFVSGKGKSTPSEYEQPGHVDSTVVEDIATWISSRNQ